MVNVQLHTAIEKHVVDGPKEVDMLQWMGRAALEMIGQSGLGYSFDTLVEGEAEHPYNTSVKQLTSSLLDVQLFREFLLPTLGKIGTSKFRRACLELIPYKDAHKLKDIIDIMDKTSHEIYEGKKEAFKKGDEAIQAQVAHGNDIISILSQSPCQKSSIKGAY
ncbi:hypothetical protein H0H81_002378 [Sphagnurus paluster]|uniref:Uncharacterized protein n=1 Tax=Sphagnurus paluster TaxID=117069 RepID=A0A9P7FS28_9AGAR|nr:hypothetical protein H0H81_002378 [Sphagnurus paluster]